MFHCNSIISHHSQILAAFGPTGWGIIAGYFVLMFVIGFSVSRKSQDARDYFLAGRSLPTWALAISIVATSLSAATFVGVPDDAYLGDIGYLILFAGTLVAVFIVALLFVPRLYRAGTVTIYGYLRPRFGDGAVAAVSCTFLIGRLLASGARLFFAAIPLCLLLFGTTNPNRGQVIGAICLIGLVGTMYTVKGGIRAVVWTDAVQLILVIGAAAMTIVILLHKIPLPMRGIYDVLSNPASGPRGHSKLHVLDTSLDFSKPYTIWAALFGAVFLNVANYGVDHDFAQRFLVSKSPLRGGISVIASQFIAMAVVCLFMTVGLLLYIFYRRPDVMGSAWPGYTPAGGLEAAYPQFLLRELPPALSGLAICGFFAVAQGSMDSAINAMASSVVADLYLPMRRRRGHEDESGRPSAAPRLAVAAMGVLMSLFAIGCALLFNSKSTLLSFALGIMSFAFAGMLGVFLTALFTRRGNAVSVIASLICGAVTIAMLQNGILAWWTTRLFGAPHTLAWPWWMPIGTAVSFLVCIMGSSRAILRHRPPHDARPHDADGGCRGRAVG
jgi:SSS family transporter